MMFQYPNGWKCKEKHDHEEGSFRFSVKQHAHVSLKKNLYIRKNKKKNKKPSGSFSIDMQKLYSKYSQKNQPKGNKAIINVSTRCSSSPEDNIDQHARKQSNI